jgi:hypothetical protein
LHVRYNTDFKHTYFYPGHLYVTQKKKLFFAPEENPYGYVSPDSFTAIRLDNGKTYETIFETTHKSLDSPQISVKIVGVSDGQRSSLQKDRDKAIIDTIRKAAERSGATIASKMLLYNGITVSDQVTSFTQSILEPGYEIIDIGYDECGSTYKVVLVGTVRVQ